MKWSTIYDADALQARFALTESLDKPFADQERKFYETRTDADLRCMAAGAWDANDSDAYVMANSYLALRKSGA